MAQKFNHLKHVFDKSIFVLLVSKIFSLCSKSIPHRPALHRTLVTLNNTFHQLIPSKKYIALHTSFFSWRYVVSDSQCSTWKELWWILLMMVIRQSKSWEIFAKRPRKYTLRPRMYFRKLLQFWKKNEPNQHLKNLTCFVWSINSPNFKVLCCLRVTSVF